MAAQIKSKDPNSVQRFFVDWRKYMAQVGETITGSSWTVPGGITRDSDGYSAAGLINIVLSGGTAGTQYTLVNRVTTSGGQTLDQTLIIDVTEQ
jgi:hypothetical protein